MYALNMIFCAVKWMPRSACHKMCAEVKFKQGCYRKSLGGNRNFEAN